MAGNFDWRLLVQAIASAMPQLEQARTARKQQEELAAGNAATMQRQIEADQAANDEIRALRESNAQKAESDSLKGYTAALTKTRAGGGGSLPPNLGGERFQGDVAAGAADVQNYGSRQAGYTAKLDAPGRQREAEGQSLARMTQKIRLARSGAETEQYLARLRAARVRPNPWVGLLSKAGSQIANNYERRGEQAEILQPFDLTQLPKRREPITGG